MKHGMIGALLTLATIASMVASDRSAVAGQTEKPIACDEAVEPISGFLIKYGEHAVCSVDATTNLDKFKFDAVAGDRIRVNAVSTTSCLDLRIEVRDPDGTVMKDTACDGHPGYNGACSTCSLDGVQVVATKTGRHLLTVSDSGTNNTGNYTIEIEKTPPAGVPGIFYNTTEADTISPTTDVDALEFDGAQGTIVRINLQGTTSCFDARLQIFDPTDTVIYNQYCDGHPGYNGACSTCALNTDQTLSMSGKYRVLISDAAVNNIGSYQIGLNCLFGDCPGTQPACTPSSGCDDQDPCTDDICDATNGCSHVGNSRPGCGTTTTLPSTTTTALPTTTTSTTLLNTTTTAAIGTTTTITPTTTSASGSTSPTTSITATTAAPTTTTIPPVCQTTVCDGSDCHLAPVANGTSCDNGDGCGPDVCQDGTCTNSTLCNGLTANQALKNGNQPLPKLVVSCSVEGGDGVCRAQGFVSAKTRDDLLARPRTAVQAQDPDDEVAVTTKADARFDKFGVARFALKMNRIGKRLLKKLAKGEKLPVVVRFDVQNGRDQSTLKRLVNLVKK